MTYVFGFSLLVVAGAVVVLFAMLGELYARTAGGSDVQSSRFVRLLPEAQVGVAPASWPASLAAFGAASHGVLIVLSTACGSCENVASQLDVGEDRAPYGDLAVLLSTGDPTKAADFLGRHTFGGLTSYVDMEGAWVTTEFGVKTSPTALVFKDGRLVSALVFSDIAVLRPAVQLEKEQA
jgi:hypothetical protein